MAIHILNELDILVLGNYDEIIYIDIKDLENLEIISKENYKSIVFEPSDFRSSSDRNFLVASNGMCDILIIKTLDFK